MVSIRFNSRVRPGNENPLTSTAQTEIARVNETGVFDADRALGFHISKHIPNIRSG